MRVQLTEAIQRLKQGEVVAIPTETVYGLAADARNDDALRLVYATKQRPANNPIIVHISDINQVADWATEFPPLAQKLAEAFWPGPLTLVFKAKHEVSTIVRAGEPTVALRVPNHPLTLQLLKESGLALAAPSANKYTQLSPTCAEHVEAGLGQNIAVLDGGVCQVGIESTIVSVQGDDWQLLRHGIISESTIAELVGKPAVRYPANTPKVPGQHLLHYSPNTPTKLFASRDVLIKHAKLNANCAALLIGEGDKPLGEFVQLPDNPTQVAEVLYNVLHRLDGLKKSEILIQLPPHSHAWQAILDRLSRAGYNDNSCL